jgi:hypothetical protein
VRQVFFVALTISILLEDLDAGGVCVTADKARHLAERIALDDTLSFQKQDTYMTDELSYGCPLNPIFPSGKRDAVRTKEGDVIVCLQCALESAVTQA